MCIRDRCLISLRSSGSVQLDVGCLTLADIGSDQRLLLGKFRMKMPRYILIIPKYELSYNINSFKQDSVKVLHERRLDPKYNRME